MTRKASRLAGVLPLEQEDKGKSRYTRLSAEADQEVERRITDSDGRKKESAVIAELVEYALHVQQLAQAAKNPAVRELLRTFDAIVTFRQQESEARLLQTIAIEFFTLRRFVATVLLQGQCNLKLLEAYLGTRKPDQLRALEAYLSADAPPLNLDAVEPGNQNASLLDALFAQWEGDAQHVISLLDKERTERLAAIANQEPAPQARQAASSAAEATATPDESGRHTAPRTGTAAAAGADS